MLIIHVTRNDIANTHGFQRGLMGRASDKRAHLRAACEERIEDCFTRFAAGARNQDHARPPEMPQLRALRVSSNNWLGLKGISSNSTPRRFRSSASSIACANRAPTGMAPASPAPLMPIGLSGDFVTVWASSIRGTSSAVGKRYTA